jgi:hypothetical protein
LMITKLDEATGPYLERLLATLRVLNPGAEMFGAVKGTETTLPSFNNVEPEDLVELVADADLPPIFRPNL